jgi:hypothetical protein
MGDTGGFRPVAQQGTDAAFTVGLLDHAGMRWAAMFRHGGADLEPLAEADKRLRQYIVAELLEEMPGFERAEAEKAVVLEAAYAVRVPG